MSEAVVNDPPNGNVQTEPSEFSLDGAAPRLGVAAKIPAPPNINAAHLQAPHMPAPPIPAPPIKTQPIESQAPAALRRPLLMSATLQSPAVVSTSTTPPTFSAEQTDAEPIHPMAHLMPTKSKPTEASRQAAETRAMKKAKAKKIKIGVIAGTLVFTAVVGPPLGKWLVDAINAEGRPSTVEEPAD